MTATHRDGSARLRKIRGHHLDLVPAIENSHAVIDHGAEFVGQSVTSIWRDVVHLKEDRFEMALMQREDFQTAFRRAQKRRHLRTLAHDYSPIGRGCRAECRRG